MRDIKGQESARRALEIAAAGGHNMLMVGPPGSGKSMLAARLPSILPPLAPRELLEISMIASIAGELTDGKLSDRRPFRAPHHSASMAAMVGGGVHARPGEVSLAHNGVLFLDEFPEFTPQVLDSLRQPLEAGEVVVARANHRVAYPSRIQLIGAMNPCRCGKAGEPGHTCRRGERCAGDYQARHLRPAARPHRHPHRGAGALRHRPDPPRRVANRPPTWPSASPRRAPSRRSASPASPKVRCNAQAGADMVEAMATPERAGMRLLEDAAVAMRLSARGYHRVLKLARTLADLDAAESVARIHIAEALSYRALPAEFSLAA